MPKIIIDRNKCIGCMYCVNVCPKSFEMFEGKARPKTGEVKKITCEKEAAEGCPVQCITVK